jgi:hypothetical protein
MAPVAIVDPPRRILMSLRSRIVLLSAVALLTAGAPAGVSDPPVAAPRPAATDHVITVLGAGPYLTGTSVNRLSAAGLLSWVTIRWCRRPAGRFRRYEGR